jgi:hypothetical protein
VVIAHALRRVDTLLGEGIPRAGRI